MRSYCFAVCQGFLLLYLFGIGLEDALFTTFFAIGLKKKWAKIHLKPMNAFKNVRKKEVEKGLFLRLNLSRQNEFFCLQAFSF